MSRLFLFAVGLLAGAAAVAQTGSALKESLRADVSKTVDQNFDKGDVNNDGFLSRAEIQTMTVKATQQVVSRMEREFLEMDKDKNGQVSVAEFKTSATAKVAQNPELTLQKFDANKDGKLSPAEFRAPVLATFDRADANKDGKISVNEAKKASRR